MQKSLWILIAGLVLALSGCQHGLLAKRNSELCCPTDIRKTINWKCGEDAIFCPPCRPDHAYYGHKPTCWRDWPSSGEEWRDGNCCICMAREPDVQATGAANLHRLPPTSGFPVENHLPTTPETPIENHLPATSGIPIENHLPAASGTPIEDHLPAASEGPAKTSPTSPSESLESNESDDLAPIPSSVDAAQGSWFVPDDLTSLTRVLSWTNQ